MRLSSIFFFYIAGLIFWSFFYFWGEYSFAFYDWVYMHQWVDVLKVALEEGRVPFYALMYEDSTASKAIFGSKFFAMPFVMVSPQFLLLKFMSVESFMFLQIIFMYTVGFWTGALWIKYLNLSTIPSAMLLIFFNFNGYIVTRIGVGHLQNMSYVLIPFFIFILYKIIKLNSQENRKLIFYSLSVSLLFIFCGFQGSLHVIHKMVIAGIVALALFPKKLLYFLGSVAVFALSYTYLIVPNLLFGPYEPSKRVVYGGYGFVYANLEPLFFNSSPGDAFEISGWNDFVNKLQMMCNIIQHILRSLITPYNSSQDASWEYSIYVGYVGLGVLVFGFCLGLSKLRLRSFNIGNLIRNRYILSIIALIFMASGQYLSAFYFHVGKYIELPKINQMPTRFIFFPLVCLFIYAIYHIDDFLKRYRNTSVMIVSSSLILILLAFSTYQFSRQWFLEASFKAYQTHKYAESCVNMPRTYYRQDKGPYVRFREYYYNDVHTGVDLMNYADCRSVVPSALPMGDFNSPHKFNTQLIELNDARYEKYTVMSYIFSAFFIILVGVLYIRLSCSWMKVHLYLRQVFNREGSHEGNTGKVLQDMP